MRWKITGRIAIACALLLLLLEWRFVANAIARAYELGYLICHYNYACLSDPETISEFTWGKKILCKKEYWNEEMRSLLERKGSEKVLSKRGKTTTERVVFKGRDMIIKRERAGSGLFCQSVGASIWNNLHVAQEKGIPTVTPVAMIETKDESAVVYLAIGTDLKAFAHKEKVTHIAKLLKKMRFSRAIHHDFRLKNVLQLENRELALIDMDKFHLYPSLSLLYQWRFYRELAKFKRDWRRKTTVPLQLYQEDGSLWRSLVVLLAKCYESGYFIFHYSYAGVYGDYFKKWGFGEKFICLKDYYDDAIKAFSMSGDVLHERSNRSTRKVEIEGQKYIVKTERSEGFFKNLFFMTRGVNIWNNAHFAKSLHFPVLTPVAMIEERHFGFTTSSVLYLMEGSNQVDVDIQDIVETMKKLRLVHHDFRPKNLVELPNHTLQCIDIDRMHRYPKFSYVYHERMKYELEKFHYQKGLVQ